MFLEREATYQIGELAKKSGLSADTLRYYERLGLLHPPQRSSGGFRVYPAETLGRLSFIRRAKLVGLTLHQIADLVSFQDQGGLTRCRPVRDLLRVKLGELTSKISELQDFRDTLSTYLDQCERTMSRGDKANQRTEPCCPVIEGLTTKP